MKIYYIAINNQSQGPYTPDELRIAGLNAKSLIWHEGLADWVEASQIPELSAYLTKQATPPPITSTQQSSNNNAKPRCPETCLALAIISTLLCCLPLRIVSIVYAATVETRWANGRYEEAEDASRKAKNWAIASIISGIVIIAIYLILVFIAVDNAHTYHYDNYDTEYTYDYSNY